MSPRSFIELGLALGALVLLARDVQRARRDHHRRPITVFMAGLMTVVLSGALGGSPHPDPGWLILPGSILAWEAARGWRLAPNSRRWEAGVAAFALGVLLAMIALSLTSGDVAWALLGSALGTGLVGALLLWRSRRIEPRAWRANDSSHYERRSHPRSSV